MPNTWTNVVPQLLAQGIMTMRQKAIMPRLVNRRFEVEAGQKGSVIDVPIPSAVAVSDVAPSNTPPAPGTSAPTKVQVTLDKWKQASFFLTDKEMLEVSAGTIPMQAAEAIKAICNQVDSDLLACYKDVYGIAGSAGVTPFASDLTGWTGGARKVLNKQLAPTEDRRVCVDEDAEANLLALAQFNSTQFNPQQGTPAEALANGQIANKLGAYWFLEQNLPTHTKGAATSGTIALDDSAARAIGTKTLHMDGFSTKPSYGDIFTIAGDTQTYTVKSATDLVGTDSDVTFEPGLKVAIPAADGNEVVTFVASHKVNLAFHRDALALASRPFADSDPMALGKFLSAVDEVTGLTLRLEVTRQHKQTVFTYDILYGVACPIPAWAARILG